MADLCKASGCGEVRETCSDYCSKHGVPDKNGEEIADFVCKLDHGLWLIQNTPKEKLFEQAEFDALVAWAHDRAIELEQIEAQRAPSSATQRTCLPCGTSWDAPVDACPSCGKTPWGPLIDAKERKPTQDALLLTTSKVWIIGDWYQGAWRTYRSEWQAVGEKLVLKSAFKEDSITHWMHLPEARL